MRLLFPLTLLAWLGRRATVVLAVGVFIGLALPGLAEVARPLLTPSVFLMLTAMLTRLSPSALITELRRLRVIAPIAVWILALCPLLMSLAMRGVDLPSGLEQAMIVFSASPVLLTSPAIGLMLGLNGALALVVVLLTTFLTPFVTPFLALKLAGLTVDLDPIAIMTRLVLLIGGALVLATVTRRLLGEDRLREAKDTIDGTVVVLMLIFAVSIMDGVLERMIQEPGLVLVFLIGTFAANLGLQLISLPLFSRLLGKIDGATGALVSGNRNMALLMAAWGSSADPDVFLFFALAQFPIYLLPLLTRPLYRRIIADR